MRVTEGTFLQFCIEWDVGWMNYLTINGSDFVVLQHRFIAKHPADK